MKNLLRASKNTPEAYAELNQTSKMEFFAKIATKSYQLFLQKKQIEAVCGKYLFVSSFFTLF